jgi:hypothetical protein
MKTDQNGCSTCPAGEECWEGYYSKTHHANFVQYDYRTQDGRLFTTVTRSLEEARSQRDQWLAKQGGTR